MSKIQLRAACEMFFRELERNNLLDHPEVFTTLDDYARNRDFMICAEQKGIFGTRLFFGRVSQHEG